MKGFPPKYIETGDEKLRTILQGGDKPEECRQKRQGQRGYGTAVVNSRWQGNYYV